MLSVSGEFWNYTPEGAPSHHICRDFAKKFFDFLPRKGLLYIEGQNAAAHELEPVGGIHPLSRLHEEVDRMRHSDCNFFFGSPEAELWRNTLSKIPTIFERLLYLAS